MADLASSAATLQKIRYIALHICFRGLMAISTHDAIALFASFGVALVALNLYKLMQPANS